MSKDELIVTISKGGEELRVLDNVNIYSEVPTGKRPGDYGSIEKYAIGAPVTVITSNAPPHLVEAINRLVKSYCNSLK